MKQLLVVIVVLLAFSQLAFSIVPNGHGGLLAEDQDEFAFLEDDPTASSNATKVNATCSATNACKNNGTCLASGSCNCTKGYSGTMCEISVCTNLVCDRFSTCNVKEGKCIHDPCKKINCLNGGSCLAGICTCTNNFTGAFCQNHPCHNIKCLNGGFCKAPGECQCLNKYFGKFCEQSPCNGVTCMNGGKCIYGDCACMPEWTGLRCERPTEAARDYKVYSDRLQQLQANTTLMGDRMAVIHNVTGPPYIANAVRNLIREIEEKVVGEAKEASKRDFMTPKVIGIVPVTAKDMKVPNTPFENAKIYEDKDLAYQKAREVRDPKLKLALGEVEKYDLQKPIDAVVIAKDVPGAEYFKGPFGGFAEVSQKYGNVDYSLLDADLESYHHQQSELDAIINS
jgi:hypothetical protein